MSSKFKYFLFYAFIFMLCIPAIQTIFNIVKEKPLEGAYLYSKKPEFSLKTWLEGSFQENTNQAVEEHIGFRPTFIRIRNQVEYSLFKKINASNVVEGKDGVLFQDFYIDAYLGKDFLGEEVLKQKVEQLAFLQNELQKRNIFLFFIIAPGKASIYSEYLPDWVNKEKQGTTNYEVCVQKMKEFNIHFLDMKNYFLQIKDTISYPLFPKCGTHWSGFGITLVADTMRKYIEKEAGIKLNSFSFEKGYATSDKNEMKFTDNDIGSAMNLLFDIPAWKVYYPNIVFHQDSSLKKPNMLSIGDSFTQSFFGFYPFFFNMFDENSRYWYYNRVISWPDSIEKKYIEVQSLNLKREIEQRKIILLVSTEQNLSKFGYGFIENVSELFDSTATFEHEERVAKYIQRIKGDNNWLASIGKKAKEKNISLSDAIKLDAEFLANQEEDRIAGYESQIKSSPDWLESVKKKANEKNIPLDKMIHLDAIWMVENSK